MKYSLTFLTIFIVIYSKASDTVSTKYQNLNKIYTSISVGYAGNLKNTDEYLYKTIGNSNYYEYLDKNEGKCTVFEGGLTYKLTPNLGFGATVGYFNGANLKYNEQLYDTSNTFIKIASNQRTQYLKISPFVIMDAPVSFNNSVYAKVSGIIGTGNTKTTFNDQFTYLNGNSDQQELTYKSTGNAITGLNVAVGFKFKIGKNQAMFIELNQDFVSQKITNREMIAAKYNGQNILKNIPTYYKQTIYTNQVPQNQTIDKNQPRKSLYYRNNYSNIGIKVGLIFYLNTI